MSIEDEDMFIKHAALILLQDKCRVHEARFKAWCEGPEGYEDRLKKDKEINDVY